ncbi:hypothetical protein SBA4_4970008 [Candidatus Sulfopaludibacter sp. SbA4]|nr:hypothetical protein SBA4_4970008 [Candidatus Sulfopaludibacter sp. SbA4]
MHRAYLLIGHITTVLNLTSLPCILTLDGLSPNV